MITIKQQNPDGQMQQINPAILAAFKSEQNSKTVFKAQISVDRKEYKQQDFVTELIQQYNNKTLKQTDLP